MNRRDALVGHAADFVSFLIKDGFMDSHRVRYAVLYGSVARGNFTEKSDIDVFVDVPKVKVTANTELRRRVDAFYSSRWGGRRPKNSISCLIGNLDEMKDLQRSIISNNVLLYGIYSRGIEGRVMSLFVVGASRSESKRVHVARVLFGYMAYGKRYRGMVDRLGGEKLAKGCFIVPVEHAKSVTSFLKRHKTLFTIQEVSIV